jgi:hypothetical protein
VVAAAAAGAAATASWSPVVVGVLAVTAATIELLRRWGVGVLLALLALGGLDALPGPNLEATRVALSATAQDCVVLLLLIVLLWTNSRDGFAGLHRRLPRYCLIWSSAFMLLWLVTVARTLLGAPTTVPHTVFTGRDFAYFALLLPLLAGTFADTRVRNTFLVTAGVGALVCGAAQAVVATGGPHLSFLVHSTKAYTVGSVIRIYTGATAVPVAALPLGVGLFLLAPSRRLRLAGAAIAVISGASVALDLTRAEYVGLTAGILLAAVCWLSVPSARARLGRRQLLVGCITVGVAVLVLYVSSPPAAVSNALTSVTQRIVSTVAALNSPNAPDQAAGTLQIRAVETQELEQVLGSHWLFGLGFLDSTDVYNPNLPLGFIRNSDVGYLNTVMTVGVFGTVIYYLPILVIPLLLLWRCVHFRRAEEDMWVAFGVTAWSVAMVIASKTLVVLFSPTGVVSAAVVLALGVTYLSRHDATETSSPGNRGTSHFSN